MNSCGSSGLITNYVINNTNGDAVFVIRQQSANGPDEPQRNTDLTLYGYQAPNWGEKFNENFYRLLENFATPSRREAHSTPGHIDYSYPHNRPADEGDLGRDGFGINNPVNGQFWFNTSTASLYIYDAAADEWVRIGPAACDCGGFGGPEDNPYSGNCGFGGPTDD